MENLRTLLNEEVASSCVAPMSFSSSTWVISVCCVLGIVWSLYNYKLVKKIHIEDMQEIELEEKSSLSITGHQQKLLIDIGKKISDVNLLTKVGCY